MSLELRVKMQQKEIDLLKVDNELLKSKWEAQGLLIQRLHKENKRYEKALKSIYEIIAYEDENEMVDVLIKTIEKALKG
jgi:redox-regulated HSP33 family molecular chaperone